MSKTLSVRVDPSLATRGTVAPRFADHEPRMNPWQAVKKAITADLSVELISITFLSLSEADLPHNQQTRGVARICHRTSVRLDLHPTSGRNMPYSALVSVAVVCMRYACMSNRGQKNTPIALLDYRGRTLTAYAYCLSGEPVHSV